MTSPSARHLTLPRWAEVSALFGGRFDPPHLGHAEAVEGLLKSPGVKEVILLPAGNPSYKPTLASAAERLEMLQILSRCPRLRDKPVRIDSYEVDQSQRWPAKPTYTIETLLSLRAQGLQHLAFVLGRDQFQALPSWHRFPEVLGLCHWIVLERQLDPCTPSQVLPPAETVIQEWQHRGLLGRALHGAPSPTWELRSGGSSFQPVVTWVQTPASGTSSSFIRKTLAQTGQVPPLSLTADLEQYLKIKTIYGKNP